MRYYIHIDAHGFEFVFSLRIELVYMCVIHLQLYQPQLRTNVLGGYNVLYADSAEKQLAH